MVLPQFSNWVLPEKLLKKLLPEVDQLTPLLLNLFIKVFKLELIT